MQTARPFVFLALLLGCAPGSGGAPADPPPTPQDKDGDGVPDGEDCGATDPAVHPGAEETCDGLDNNCDGAVDEGWELELRDWYLDRDGDGWGDDTATLRRCVAPVGYVERGGDCNDHERADHPGADEWCDGRDHDCDGVVMEEDALDRVAWFHDGDGDGYGDPDDHLVSCEPPAGYVANDADCDDYDAAVSPAAREVCDDWDVDEDCDGRADDHDREGATGAEAWLPDRDEDGAGDAAGELSWACDPVDGRALGTGDCDDTDPSVQMRAWYTDDDGDGFGAEPPREACAGVRGEVEVGGDCDDADPARHPGADEPDCADPTDWNCDGMAGPEDHDGDGAPACGDCDDADPTRAPTAEERCDGLDDDCDGAADEGVEPTGWHRDADGDGYGDPTLGFTACEGREGWVADARDCDDADRGVNPDGTEACGGADEDCDGEVDEAGALECDEWWPDEDGDGEGGGEAACLCRGDAEHPARTGEDCDDDDPSVRPGIEDAPGDDVDADCDGWFGAESGALTRVTWGVYYGDLAGQSLAAGDLDGDGLTDAVVGLPGDDTQGNDAGAVWLFRGPVTDVSASRWTLWGPVEHTRAGWALVVADLDADGQDDLVVGAPDADGAAGSEAGAAWLLLGPTDTDGLLDVHDAAFEGDRPDADAGRALGLSPDLDGDGAVDLLVGAPEAGDGLLGVWPGSTLGEQSLPAPVGVAGDESFDAVGSALDGTADLDGDGAADLVLGSWRTEAVLLYAGPLSGALGPGDADARLTGAGAPYGWGGVVQTLGDLDGDGLPELAVTSREDLELHSFAAGFAAPAGAWASFPRLLAVSDPFMGEAATWVGDPGGDGQPDLLVGTALQVVPSGSGSLWLFEGPFSGTLGEEDAAYSLAGDPETGFGYHLLSLGDADGDGLDDLLVRAEEAPDLRWDAGLLLFLPGSDLAGE